MSDKSQTSAADHLGLLFGLVLLMGATLLASSVPVTIALLIGTLGWFFGSATRVALLAIAGGVLSSVITWRSGETVAYVTRCAALYTGLLAEPRWLFAVVKQWFNLSLDRQTWIVQCPLGLIGSGFWLLLRQDRKNSPDNQVFIKPERARPSPWARIRTFVVARWSGALMGAAITIGVEIATGKRVRISLQELGRHLFVIGRSGRGKTQSILMVAWGAARLGIPILYVDGKGDPEVKNVLARIAQENHREFYLLDAMRPEESCAYDALANKNITMRKDMMIQLRSWSEPHYQGKAGTLAQTVFKAMDYAGVHSDLHTFGRNLSVSAMLALARRGAGRKGTYDRMTKEILARRTDEKTAVDSLASEVASLTDASFGDVFDIQSARLSGRRILRLQEAREQAAIAYFGLPALAYPDAASRLASLIVGDLKASLAASQTQWLIIFDEFSAFANPTTTLNLINMGRSHRASMCIATQSCADFSASGSESFLRQVFGSVNTFLIHELTDPMDAELIAGLFSTMSSVEYTAQIVGHQRTGSASSRSVRQFRIHPEWIKNLGIGEAYVLNKDRPNNIAHTKILRAPL
jgi:hypothetical protein